MTPTLSVREATEKDGMTMVPKVRETGEAWPVKGYESGNKHVRRGFRTPGSKFYFICLIL